MKGEVTIIFVDPKKEKFSENSAEYQKCSIVDNEGLAGTVYIPASVSPKFGNKVIVSCYANEKNIRKFKYILEENK